MVVTVSIDYCTAAVAMFAASVWGDRHSRHHKAVSMRPGGRAVPTSHGVALSQAAARGPDCERSMAWAGAGKAPAPRFRGHG